MDEVLQGDMRTVLQGLEENSIDAVVTDPPYGLHFMGAAWDRGVPGIAFWQECFRVLKPGGHLLSFGGTRTWHRLAVAIEDAGFELRDTLMWLCGSGMPKSLNISKAIDKSLGAAPRVVGANPLASKQTGQRGTKAFGDRAPSLFVTAPTTPQAKLWDGWGTGLKPAVEPILLCRKPISERIVADNVLKWGTGALYVDGCRVPYTGDADRDKARVPQPQFGSTTGRIYQMKTGKGRSGDTFDPQKGRWPSNILIQCTCENPQPLPEEVQERKGPSRERRYTTKGSTNFSAKPGALVRRGGGFIHEPECPAGVLDKQEPGASRFFTVIPTRFMYCPKASRKERGEGNRHATVKPLAMMRWLIRLVTPPQGVVLDPFCGSGSTLIAAKQEGFHYLGVEINEEYCKLARWRLDAVE